MDRLIFTATTALNEYRLDRQSLTHELANVSTTGFKSPLRWPTARCESTETDLIRGFYLAPSP